MGDPGGLRGEVAAPPGGLFLALLHGDQLPVWGSGLIRGRAGCSLGFASGHLNFKRAAGLNECS